MRTKVFFLAFLRPNNAAYGLTPAGEGQPIGDGAKSCSRSEAPDGFDRPHRLDAGRGHALAPLPAKDAIDELTTANCADAPSGVTATRLRLRASFLEFAS